MALYVRKLGTDCKISRARFVGSYSSCQEYNRLLKQCERQGNESEPPGNTVATGEEIKDPKEDTRWERGSVGVDTVTQATSLGSELEDEESHT